MSTATIHPLQEPGAPPELRLVDPEQQRRRFAWLLFLKRQAARAWDAFVSAPRRAAMYLGRLVPALPAGSTQLLTRLGAAGRSVLGQLGPQGLVAGAVAAASNPRIRRLVSRAVSAIGRVAGSAARSAFGLVRRGLGLFGASGQRTAARLDATASRAGGFARNLNLRVNAVLARLAAQHAGTLAAIGQVARVLVLHRLLRGAVARPLVRVLLEAVLLPGSLARTAWRHLTSLFRRMTTGPDPTPPSASPAGYPASWAAHEETLEAEAGGATVNADLTPGNRAERRAQQRQGARKRNQNSRTR